MSVGNSTRHMSMTGSAGQGYQTDPNNPKKLQKLTKNRILNYSIVYSKS